MNLLQKIQENLGTSWEKYHLWKSENLNFRNFQNSRNLMCPLFEFLKFRIPELLIIRNDEFLEMMKVEDEECPDINFPLIKYTTAWI